MAASTLVLQLSADQNRRLKSALTEAGFADHPTPYADYGFKGDGMTVVLYSSGKLTVQGKAPREFLAKHLPDSAPKGPAVTESMIGADESGKGDYFGALVVAACALTPEVAPFLDEVPLRDSKTMSPREITEAAETLKRVLPHKVLVLWPRKYNELYAKIGNLNKLLAWAHATAIKEVVAATGVKKVLLDKFCDQKVVERALGEARNGLDFRMEVRAESNPAVAAASILARDAFVGTLKYLEREHGARLPLGCGAPVTKALKVLVAEKGRDILPEVAKMHFKTTASA